MQWGICHVCSPIFIHILHVFIQLDFMIQKLISGLLYGGNVETMNEYVLKLRFLDAFHD